MHTIGAYKLGAAVSTTDLIEFSPTEYAVMGRQFKDERNFNAAPVEFLGYRWNLQLGTVAGRIYKIAPHLLFPNKRDANPVAMAALHYCTEQFGKPASQQTGLFIWDTTDGNVILQTAETAEGLSISLFLTAKTVRTFERL